MSDVQRLNAILAVMRHLNTLPEVRDGLRALVDEPGNALFQDLMAEVRNATKTPDKG